jgi:N-methylhydantoinase A
VVDHHRSESNEPTWPCAIAVDVGGTFTDLVMLDASGHQWVAKVPSTPRDPAVGVLDAVDVLGDDLAVPRRELLGHCARFVHGSTVATNAVLERTLAPVGLLTTEGFRDALEIRRGIREDQWDHRAPWPPVVVPRSRRLGIRERVAADGREVVPLDEEAVRSAGGQLAADGVEAVAVSFLHSYLDPGHEQRAAEILRERWPGARTTASTDVMPLLGEYARTSTAVVNAGLVPRVGGYLERLAGALSERGLNGTLLMLASNGGTVPVGTVAARPVDLVLSGPAAVGGALRRTAAATGIEGAMVSMEIGGTSCDVAVMADGSVDVTDGLVVGGYHLAVPAVDVHTIGAGGGTIAWIDEGGLLHVGPKGAGADPGPACYGKGGIEPTVTDAHLVLGRLRPGPYAGGSVVLDDQAASRALTAQVGAPLDLNVEDAAIGVLRLLEQHLRQAVETITIERGRDPGRMTLVAAGGAGGLHGSAVARALGCRQLLVPAEAGVFCAMGMLHSDLRRDVSRSIVGRLDELGADGVHAALEIEADRATHAVADEWPPGVAADTEWYVDLRYPGQLFSLRVGVEPASTAASIRASFEDEYERRYGHIQPGGALDVTAVGVVSHGRLEVLTPPRLAPADAPVPVVEHRRCWIDPAHGWQEVPVIDGASLAPDHELTGPYLIEARTTTVLGLPGDRCRIGAGGDLLIDLGPSEEHT